MTIYDYGLFELDIELPIKDYRNWLIVDVKHEPPNISDYVLKGNKVFICHEVTDIPVEGKELQLFRCKFDLLQNVFVNPDGQSLEITTDTRTAKQSVLVFEDGRISIEGSENDYDNLLKQALYGFDLENLHDFYFVFSTNEVYKFTNENWKATWKNYQ